MRINHHEVRMTVVAAEILTGLMIFIRKIPVNSKIPCLIDITITTMMMMTP